MNPLVSIVITTFNQEAFIADTIRSALAQTYHPREIIVVDDGSTDATPVRVAALGAHVKYVRQRNQGVAQSRNTGVRHASGELIAFLDGDDLWEPEKLAVQVDLHRQYPHAGVLVVDSCMFDTSEVLAASTLPWGRGFLDAPEGEFFCGRSYSALLPNNFIMTTSQVMIPAKVLGAIGASDPFFKIASDYDLYLRIASRYDIAFVRRTLTRWRYLPTSASGPSALRPFRCGLDEIRVVSKQVASTRGAARRNVVEVVQKKSALAAWEAYHYGWTHDRAFALRFLLELWHGNRRSIWPLVYWMALACPRWIQGALRSMFGVVMPAHRRRLRNVESDSLATTQQEL
jgi:glycosyltransferase involved in cell wall biosynthesis